LAYNERANHPEVRKCFKTKVETTEPDANGLFSLSYIQESKVDGKTVSSQILSQAYRANYSAHFYGVQKEDKSSTWSRK
jgi:hypothetical protein